MNPSFFEGKDFTRAHRALHFLKEMLVARSLLFLMEKIARRVAMPFCFLLENGIVVLYFERKLMV